MYFGNFSRYQVTKNRIIAKFRLMIKKSVNKKMNSPKLILSMNIILRVLEIYVDFENIYSLALNSIPAEGRT